MLSGFDTAFGPSLAVARQAKTDGAAFWWGYIGGLGAFHAWRADEYAVIRQAGLIPGSLWVPTFGLTENSVDAAIEAVDTADVLGLYGAIMLDTEYQMSFAPNLHAWVDSFCATVARHGRPCPVYSGAHYVPVGVADFAPNWGSTVFPTSGNAVQYGPATRYGLRVDVDLADPAFPLASFTPPTPPAPPPVVVKS